MDLKPINKKLYIETYGCQMNVSDSEIVGSIMKGIGYEQNDSPEDADVIFINTCSIRDNAEQRVRKRLHEIKKMKKRNPNLTVGILGCMAERLKEKLIEEQEFVDLIVGPDAYRELPGLIKTVDSGRKAINVLLSEEETYSEIEPVRYGDNGISAFISIMRGCQNWCTYCVVPFTRGKERSRDPHTIIKEAKELFAKGYKEVTLLGQNVNSYKWDSEEDKVGFHDLLRMVSEVSPLLRVRFATSHPKDISDDLIKTIAAHHNICNYIHLPVQSGSSAVLKKMHRKYTREWYMERIETIKKHIPDVGLSTDIIAGFCSETEEDHQETLSLMEWVAYDYAFMFKYSERPDTIAAKKFDDDVPEEVKSRRLQEIIEQQQKSALMLNKQDIGKTFEVLVEKVSKKSDEQLAGRNSQNKMIVFPRKDYKPGDYAMVKVLDCTAATLIGEVVD
ncbi:MULTISPECIES: tRNA (N6-isopentenyl adenosine(37)-C2)-methylthiotransferase MiaB [unclassified Lentimicrobium]|uniref:tRNA (N6-isopentenyl adenosine(37)-C2)-methylthiotransferase MiaB n=1 Tax=unclassified Lentimicrobium TaxID=2677434 RepID=UPI001555ADA5|nr:MULTISPECIES: tRNA (N6-isopentenyl adenosine(37)-C2)-methylthiotransferase MiaB [unclassified Lentimicrobium]NPD44242.1 tRNA (N6-isopentenyl adenosine(37)-C2)-methylthiotransferase MiaB [Lentimicrobium sp. S6]NPD85780.1 tRNA (N6-isopentenyl adenosine(37)-C2)-methylthiotransferase MiaB [Lentimicrobium sp. L6]